MPKKGSTCESDCGPCKRRGVILCEKWCSDDSYEHSESSDCNKCPSFCGLADDLPPCGQQPPASTKKVKIIKTSSKSRCKSCNDCKKCRPGKRCDDHSLLSVIESLNGSESSDSCACPTFCGLADDLPPDCIVVPVEEPQVAEEKKASETKQASEKSASVKVKEFRVSFVNKTGHQWAKMNKDDVAIAVSGHVGPNLTLKKGQVYHFKIENNNNYSFMLTTNPAGGPDAQMLPGATIEERDGQKTLVYTVDDKTPTIFYYHSPNGLYWGGHCKVLSS